MDKKLVFEKALEALKKMRSIECASFCWAFAYAICHIKTGRSLSEIIDEANYPIGRCPKELDYFLGQFFTLENLTHRKPLTNMDFSYWFPRYDFDTRIKILEEEISLMNQNCS